MLWKIENTYIIRENIDSKHLGLGVHHRSVIVLKTQQVKDYDCKILYCPSKANVVADALSRKLAGSSVGETCMMISVGSLLLGLIREA